MLTSEQQDLLIKIGIYQQMGDGADFTLFRSSDNAELQYPNGVSVECVAPDEDFQQLERSKLIVLSRDSGGQLSGRLTEYGKVAAFGMPSGKSYGGDLTLKLVPKGTRAYEIVSDSMSWAKERMAFHYVETVQNLPAESASDQEFRDFCLNTIAGKYDIEAESFLKDSKLTPDTIAGCEKLLIAAKESAGTNRHPKKSGRSD